jgi:hypothetical protein
MWSELRSVEGLTLFRNYSQLGFSFSALPCVVPADESSRCAPLQGASPKAVKHGVVRSPEWLRVSASQHPRVVDVALARLGDQPFARAPDPARLQDVVTTGRTLCACSTGVANRDAPIRVGCVVLVELRRNLQALG